MKLHIFGPNNIDAYYLCITQNYVHEFYVFHVCTLKNALYDKPTNAHF
jgi:hypothetical protein